MKTALQLFASKQYDLAKNRYGINIIKDTKYFEELNNILQQALELEKEQILNARLDGFKSSAEGWNGEHPFEGTTDFYISLEIENDKYYNNTFKKKHKTHKYPCYKCGKEILIHLNKYDNTNSGKGTCECGAEVSIN